MRPKVKGTKPSIFGARLAELIRERADREPGFSESVLARRIKVPQQRINGITTGRTQFPRGTLASELANFFGVSAEYFYREGASRQEAKTTMRGKAMPPSPQGSNRLQWEDESGGSLVLPITRDIDVILKWQTVRRVGRD